MSRKQRHRPAPEEYADPLSNYEPPVYLDPMEQALCEEAVTAIQSQPAPSVPPDTTVQRAMQVLDGLDIACLLVAEDDRLLGVFTERDMLKNVAEEYDQIREQPVSNVMTSDPVAVYETDNPATALCVMATYGLRHVPVLDVNDKIVGVVSPKRLVSFIEQHFGDVDS